MQSSIILKHFKKVDPLLYRTVQELGGLIEIKIRHSDDYFQSLCSAIISQQLSGKVADVTFGRFQKLFPNELITPDQLVKIDHEKLRAVGMSNSKARFLRDLAEKVIAGEIHLEKLNEMENETVIEELVKVKGIGKWTAEMFLMFSLGREDVFSTGDLGLKNAIKKIYGLETVTEEQLLEISNKWSPYRTYASLILWRSLDNR